MTTADADELSAVKDLFGVVERLCFECTWAAVAGDQETLSALLDQAEQLLEERARHVAAHPTADAMS